MGGEEVGGGGGCEMTTPATDAVSEAIFLSTNFSCSSDMCCLLEEIINNKRDKGMHSLLSWRRH